MKIIEIKAAGKTVVDKENKVSKSLYAVVDEQGHTILQVWAVPGNETKLIMSLLGIKRK